MSFMPLISFRYRICITKSPLRILIASNDVQLLMSLGFKPKRLILKEHNPNRDCKHFVRVTRITPNYCESPTYCFTEEKRHMGVFNGILTGQCTEIMQYSSPTEIAVCNLASIALPKFIHDGQFDHHKLFDAVCI